MSSILTVGFFLFYCFCFVLYYISPLNLQICSHTFSDVRSHKIKSFWEPLFPYYHRGDCFIFPIRGFFPFSFLIICISFNFVLSKVWWNFSKFLAIFSNFAIKFPNFLLTIVQKFAQKKTWFPMSRDLMCVCVCVLESHPFQDYFQHVRCSSSSTFFHVSVKAFLFILFFSILWFLEFIGIFFSDFHSKNENFQPFPYFFGVIRHLFYHLTKAIMHVSKNSLLH